MKRQIIATVIVLIMCSVSLVYAPPTGWRSAVDLKGYCEPTPHFDPRIAVGPNGIHVISRNAGESIRCWDAVYNRSTDTGVEWDDGICLETKPPIGHDKSVDIAVIGNNVSALYEFLDTQWEGIKYRESTNNGTTWNSSVEVVADGIHPRIAVDGTLLHSFYARDVGSNYETFRKQSTNSGGSWSTEQQLTDAVRNSWHPAVCVNGNTIHLVWADEREYENYEIYYNKSTNHGGSWVWGTSGYQFTDVTGESEYPDIVAYSDENYNAVHVVWQDATTEDPGPGIYYRRSTNNGVDWQDPVLLFANGGRPSIAADERGLYVVWDKDGYVYYKESTDWGTTWQTTLRITNTADADSFPDITADDLGRHIVFARNHTKIYYIQRDIVNPAKPCSLRKYPLTVPPPVVLCWDANTEPDIWGYKVYRRLLPAGAWGPRGHTTDTTYTDNWVNPGSTYQYYITARDLAGNYSVPSNTLEVYVPDPTFKISLGDPDPSIFTEQRSGYHAWGKDADSTADFGRPLRYKFANLNPEHEYTFGFVLFEPAFDSGRVVSLYANNYTLFKDFAIPESAQWVCFRIPKSLYSQGSLAFIVSGEHEAALSQIGIWEWGKGGPQSNGTMLIDPSGLEMFITPNPVKRMASIDYVVPFDTKVKLAIYDATGKMTKTVINTVQAAGSYKKSVDVSCLPNGIYFIKLDMGDHSLVQKTVIIK